MHLTVMPYGICGSVICVASAEIAAAYFNIRAGIVFTHSEFGGRIVSATDRARMRLLDLYHLGCGIVCRIVIPGKHTVKNAYICAARDLNGMVVGAVLENDIFKQDIVGTAPDKAAHLALHIEHSACDRKIRTAVASVIMVFVIYEHIPASVGAQHGKVAARYRALYSRLSI